MTHHLLRQIAYICVSFKTPRENVPHEGIERGDAAAVAVPFGRTAIIAAWLSLAATRSPAILARIASSPCLLSSLPATLFFDSRLVTTSVTVLVGRGAKS